MKEIISENYNVEGIPVKTYFQKSIKNAPVIFILHGLTSSKEDTERGLGFGYTLAQKGFYSITLDAYLHGERKDDNSLTFNSKIKEQVFFEIVARTGDDIDTLLDFFANKSECNVNKAGITGISLGGMITFYTIANNERIKAAVPIFGAPYFERYASDESKNNPNIKRDSEEYQKYISFIKEIDPASNIKNFYPKPLLMINGEYDRYVPPIYAKDLYEELKSDYNKYPERLGLKIYPVGHDVIGEMKNDMVEWFEKHLLSQMW